MGSIAWAPKKPRTGTRIHLQCMIHLCRLAILVLWILPVTSSGNIRRKRRGSGSRDEGEVVSAKRLDTEGGDGAMIAGRDSGARYRLRIVNSHPPRFLYQLGDTIVAHRAFFSLFRWEHGGWDEADVNAGARVLGDHAGIRWLSLLKAGNDRRAFSSPSSFLGLGLSNANGTGMAQLFWPRPAKHPACVSSNLHPAECFELHVDALIASNALSHASSHPTFISTASETRSAPAIIQFERVLPSNGATGKQHPLPREEVSFAERTRRCKTKSLSGREFVLVTYHNVGMLDWAVLFWRWLHSSGLRRFMLLDLDGKTCSAAATLNSSLHFECATARDMASLSPNMRVIRDASRMQEWGTDADSGYFKFLRWKLAVVELLLREGVDALMADVDVLVLSPSFYEGLAASPYDMTISSDARSGRYSDNRHCPCSHSAYQRYATDWVCAGLFYMRSTQAALWFIDEVVAMMDQFVITDQDAIQAVLTGHTQVAVPQTRRVNGSSLPGEKTGKLKSHAVMRGYRPSAQWLKPLWLEGLEPGETLRNMKGLQPLNTPMRPNMWERVSKRRAASGFNWTTAPVEKYANGPMLIEHWVRTFSREPASRAHKGGKAARRRLERFASVHANCNVKEFLCREENSGSFLLYP
jgi:hypothetical protein